MVVKINQNGIEWTCHQNMAQFEPILNNTKLEVVVGKMYVKLFEKS